MWKRDEGVRPATPSPAAPSVPPVQAPAAEPAVAPQRPPSYVRDIVNIGKSVVIKGELSGSEDLIIEGQVEGKIELRQNVLTIGPNGKIKAQIFAKAVVVQGEVTGNITATEKVDIRDNGSVDGDITSPRVAIAEGAHFRGSIDMQRGGTKPAETRPEERPAAEPRPAGDAKAAPGQAPAAQGKA
jgi:cytoskeletal protein CcmA (bactofilin family)